MSRVHRLVRPLYLSAIATASCCAAPVDLALHTLGSILRNSVLYVGVGWFFGFCFATGDLFTGLPQANNPTQHSAPPLCLGFGACFLFYDRHHVGQVTSRAVYRMLIEPDSSTRSYRVPGAKYDLITVYPKVGSTDDPSSRVGGVLCRRWRFPCVLDNATELVQIQANLVYWLFLGFYSMVIADIYARRIFQTETVRGIVANRLKNLSPKAPVLASPGKRPNKLHQVDEHPHSKPFWTPTPRRILQVYRKNLPVIVFVLIAIVYVHALSQFIHLTGKWGCSLVLVQVSPSS